MNWLLTISEFPTSESVLSVTEENLAARVNQLCPSRSARWASEKAKKTVGAAMRNPFLGESLPSHLFSLDMYIKTILQYQEYLSALENKIDALDLEIEEYKIIQSTPGIGGKIAATIVSEIGAIDRFNHPMKLVAFAGVDPRVSESGKFTATINRISKRGSSRLRHTLFVAVLQPTKEWQSTIKSLLRLKARGRKGS